MSAKRVCILGNYSGRNAGDAAILTVSGVSVNGTLSDQRLMIVGLSS